MKTAVSALAVLALLLMIPVSAQADETPLAQQILGKWQCKSMQFGEEVEELPEGALVAEFMADGTMKSIEEGEETNGKYEIEGDKITVYMDIDDEEGEEMNLKIEGNTATFWVEEQGMKVSFVFTRMDG
ncbi:MAG: hypothetical protein AAGC44_07595 [Planctomycetota bacterium]